MRVWLVNTAENTVATEPDGRPYRMSLLTDQLIQRGHDVMWWTATFRHIQRTFAFTSDQTVTVFPKLTFRYLHAPGYQRRVGLARLRHLRALAQRFQQNADDFVPPDLIVCSCQTLDLAAEAIRFAADHDIPSVMDVRDLWPDSFVAALPAPLRPLARLGVIPYHRLMRTACRRATAILGHTDPFVEWGVQKAGRTRTWLDRAFPLGAADPLSADASADSARAEAPDWLGASDDHRPIVAYAGVMGHHQRIDTVLEAARFLQQRRIPVRFVLCGDGDFLARHRDAAAGLNNVVFPGWVDKHEVAMLLRHAAFALVPYAEGAAGFVDSISNKCIEYLGYGLPVLSSLDRGVYHDLLVEHGCGATYHGNAADLADQITQLVRMPNQREQMARAARRVFEEQFEASKVYAAMVTHLERIVRRWPIARRSAESTDPRRAA